MFNWTATGTAVAAATALTVGSGSLFPVAASEAPTCTSENYLVGACITTVSVPGAVDRLVTFSRSTFGTEWVMTWSSGLPPWPGCGVNEKATKLLKSYKRAQIAGYAGATANLKCGNHDFRTDSGWGFRHIKARHLDQWQNEAAILGGQWMDFADWSMTAVLSKPCYKAYQATNSTFQYIAPIQIKDRRGKVVKTIGVRVVVSKATNNVITAYPQKKTCS